MDGAVCAAARAAAHALRRARRLARRLARVALRRMVWIETGPACCPTARSRRFGGWFGSRQAWRLARRLARGASADGSTHTRRRARRLAYIVSIRDGPGGLPDGSLVSLRRICASADGSIRDGPGVVLARGASADGSPHTRRRARRLAYIVSIRDRPGGWPDASLVYRFGVMVGSSDASA